MLQAKAAGVGGNMTEGDGMQSGGTLIVNKGVGNQSLPLRTWSSFVFSNVFKRRRKTLKETKQQVFSLPMGSMKIWRSDR